MARSQLETFFRSMLLVIPLSIVGCEAECTREEPFEEVGEETEEIGEEMEDSADEAGDAIEDAVDEDL